MWKLIKWIILPGIILFIGILTILFLTADVFVPTAATI